MIADAKLCQISLMDPLPNEIDLGPSCPVWIIRNRKQAARLHTVEGDQSVWRLCRLIPSMIGSIIEYLPGTCPLARYVLVARGIPEVPPCSRPDRVRQPEAPLAASRFLRFCVSSLHLFVAFPDSRDSGVLPLLCCLPDIRFPSLLSANPAFS